MSVVSELIRTEADGTISFGNYELPAKSKKSDFEHDGDLYKVKTFKEITKLERNGMFVYESVPGTAVSHLKATENGMSFTVECPTRFILNNLLVVFAGISLPRFFVFVYGTASLL